MKTSMLPIVFFLFLTTSTSCNNSVDTQGTSAAISKTETPPIKLSTLQGKAIDLGLYKGKVVFLNFWATWCKPCVGEMSSIQELQKKFNNQDVEFLLASDESIDDISRFQQKNSYEMNFVQLENLSDLNLEGLPTTYIFDKKGKLVFSEVGARNWNDSSSVNLISKISTQ